MSPGSGGTAINLTVVMSHFAVSPRGRLDESVQSRQCNLRSVGATECDKRQIGCRARVDFPDAVNKGRRHEIGVPDRGTQVQVDTEDRQLLLWPQYSFDTIPLEFISSVYEGFLNEDRDANKAYYTPPQLVDYVLDAVLPWADEWDIRVLDPACGSGIFLVKAFQRLLHRWRQAHDRDALVRDLKPILAGNLHGVDINPDAVRPACFCLYLAMGVADRGESCAHACHSGGVS